MADIWIRPDLRTAGGEVSDIMMDDRYVGTLSIVFREQGRMAGAVQVDNNKMDESVHDQLMEGVNNYIQSLIDALDIEECEVLVTWSPFEYVIATDGNVGEVESVDDESEEETTSESRDAPAPVDTSRYELVIIGEQNGDMVEYHVYDGPRTWVAEAFIRFEDSDASGEIVWRSHKPRSREIEEVTEMLVSDFDHDQIDAVYLDIKYGDQWIESIELDRAALTNTSERTRARTDEDSLESESELGYTVREIRDDGDVITYDLHHKSTGALPVARATMDISHRDITGFVDLFEANGREDREEIGAALLREMDKKSDFDSVHLTLLYDNEPIDELIFETTHP